MLAPLKKYWDKNSYLKKWLLFIGGSMLIAFLALLIFLPENIPNPKDGSSLSRVSADQATPALPVRLKIPKINVDAQIESLGLTAAGLMDVPKGPSNAAWYNRGQHPGEVGSAVIDGHSGWKDGIPAVFDNLHLLQKGDEIYVEDERGQTIKFIVRSIRTYDPAADATSVFGSIDGKAHLNLITCDGDWNALTKSSLKRLVVFADRATE